MENAFYIAPNLFRAAMSLSLILNLQMPLTPLRAIYSPEYYIFVSFQASINTGRSSYTHIDENKTLLYREYNRHHGWCTSGTSNEACALQFFLLMNFLYKSNSRHRSLPSSYADDVLHLAEDTSRMQ